MNMCNYCQQNASWKDNRRHLLELSFISEFLRVAYKTFSICNSSIFINKKMFTTMLKLSHFYVDLR
jgi:hypothetical protein